MTSASPSQTHHPDLDINLLDRLIHLRGLIARHGETGGRDWWPDEILDPSVGLVVTARLFPRTHKWAALELAMSAAGHTELAQLNRRAAVTLFNMPESIERAVDLRLRELKIEAPDARGHIPEALLSRGPPDLGERITEEIGEPPNEAARSGWTQEGDRLYIGEISEARLMEGDGFEETIGCLAWAYHSMKEGSLIVPYLTLNGGGHQ